ncbi:hypothetical protein [Jannaschia formosa]|uniref:hypothetical protein n=1 Tax=Jannaschia formosa TaxID=2259592 RepID=UPI000E1BE705|nr:hypothetical protein [Jannaschia formosa]TFL18193.1 hypothetical protein DR046_10600 [Jannaschia formosa]
MRIKVFGERNTGTNALESLIRLNSRSVVLPGSLAALDADATDRLRGLRKSGAPAAQVEAWVDAVFEGKDPSQQWKHCATLFETPGALADDTHVVFLIRHPLSWLLSLYRNPYHCLVAMPDRFVDFVALPWKTTARDRLDGAVLTPPALYEAKLASYRRFMIRLDAAGIGQTVLRFEDVVMRQVDCFTALRPVLSDPSPTPRPVERSWKDKRQTLDDLRAYYSEERWREDIETEALERIAIDPEILAWAGYDLA